MSISGPLTLLALLIAIAIVLTVAHWRGLIDRLAHRLEGPPARPEQRARQCSHLKVVRNGPPRWQRGPCDMDGWDDPEGGAA